MSLKNAHMLYPCSKDASAHHNPTQYIVQYCTSIPVRCRSILKPNNSHRRNIVSTIEVIYLTCHNNIKDELHNKSIKISNNDTK